MAVEGRKTPKRLIICVDGTWCREDGVHDAGNQTNTYRISASVQQGDCTDDTSGKSWIQETVYVEGLGAADNLDFVQRNIAGAFGKGYSKQVKDVYKRCCNLGPNDEVWLYGFSRGAFVVRAVAGLLHNIRVIRATGEQFERDYKEALKFYPRIREQKRKGSV